MVVILLISVAAFAQAPKQKEIIQVTGSAVPPAGMNPGQGKLMARRGAIVDAYRQIAEIVAGVKVDSQTVVKNFVTESDVIKTKVDALIKGAKIVDEIQNADGSYSVTMQIKVSDIMAVMPPPVQIAPPPIMETPPPAPEEEPKPKTKDSTNFFGTHIKRGNWDPEANKLNDKGLKSLSARDYAGAADRFRQSVDIQDSFDIAWANLAIALSGQGDTDGAKRCYEKAISIDPEWSDHHVNLGHLYLQLGQVEDAFAEGKTAVSIYKDNEWAHHLLGLIRLNRGEYQDAAGSFRNAINLTPEDDPYLPEYFYLLGVAYEKANDVKKAKDAYQKALKYRPDFWEAKEALKEIG